LASTLPGGCSGIVVDARVALFSGLSLEVLWPIVHIGLLMKLMLKRALRLAG